MTPKIHLYVSKEPVVRPNAFIIEADQALVIVDTTLTMSDSKALRQVADELGKPLAGVLLTHGHPDHVAGTANVAPGGNVPIYALRSVNDLMKASEPAKHRQWSAMFKDEWIPRWIYPNRLVADGERVTLAGLSFRVLDLGAGGDCDANSIWLLEDDHLAAFVGDFLFNRYHTYMADGSVLRWMANLERFSALLSTYATLYVGHGSPGDRTLIDKQRGYLMTACATALEATAGTAVFAEDSKKSYEQAMFARFPGYEFAFAVALSADALVKELVGVKNYAW
jgi:glyoxylase-like metal-dependent hydrolase (beta-lactamase superfamily II)